MSLKIPAGAARRYHRPGTWDMIDIENRAASTMPAKEAVLEIMNARVSDTKAVFESKAGARSNVKAPLTDTGNQYESKIKSEVVLQESKGGMKWTRRPTGAPRPEHDFKHENVFGFVMPADAEIAPPKRAMTTSSPPAHTRSTSIQDRIRAIQANSMAASEQVMHHRLPKQVSKAPSPIAASITAPVVAPVASPVVATRVESPVVTPGISIRDRVRALDNSVATDAPKKLSFAPMRLTANRTVEPTRPISIGKDGALENPRTPMPSSVFKFPTSVSTLDSTRSTSMGIDRVRALAKTTAVMPSSSPNQTTSINTSGPTRPISMAMDRVRAIEKPNAARQSSPPRRTTLAASTAEPTRPISMAMDHVRTTEKPSAAMPSGPINTTEPTRPISIVKDPIRVPEKPKAPLPSSAPMRPTSVSIPEPIGKRELIATAPPAIRIATLDNEVLSASPHGVRSTAVAPVEVNALERPYSIRDMINTMERLKQSQRNLVPANTDDDSPLASMEAEPVAESIDEESVVSELDNEAVERSGVRGNMPESPVMSKPSRSVTFANSLSLVVTSANEDDNHIRAASMALNAALEAPISPTFEMSFSMDDDFDDVSSLSEASAPVSPIAARPDIDEHQLVQIDIFEFPVIKHGRMGRPKRVFLTVDLEDGAIRWGDGKRVIPIEDVLQIRSGRQTPVLQRQSIKNLDPLLCMSIVTKKRTLDLQCKTREERKNVMVSIMNQIVLYLRRQHVPSAWTRPV